MSHGKIMLEENVGTEELRFDSCRVFGSGTAFPGTVRLSATPAAVTPSPGPDEAEGPPQLEEWISRQNSGQVFGRALLTRLSPCMFFGRVRVEHSTSQVRRGSRKQFGEERPAAAPELTQPPPLFGK